MRRSRSGLLLAALLSLAVEGCSSTDPRPDTRRPSRTVAPKVAVKQPTFGETYVVARGDTLFSIAFRNQLDYHELADWNGIGRDYAIHPGQVLRLTSPGVLQLPSPAAATEGSAAPKLPAAPVKPAAPTPPTPGIASTGAGAGSWEWPTRGKLLRGYGADNKGIDIGGDAGQIIIASRAGKVVYSGSALKGYGELIIIKHDEDFLSAYGYNRRRLVQEGETVVGGQPIAELGTGPEQKALLHFEIRERGKPVDPGLVLPRR